MTAAILIRCMFLLPGSISSLSDRSRHIGASFFITSISPNR
jgi:hypothetical protein